MDNVDELVIDFVTAQNGRRDYYAGRNIAAEIKAIEDEMKDVTQQTEKASKKQVVLRSEMKKTTSQANLLSKAFKFLGGYFALSKLGQMADEYAQIKSTLAILTDTDEQRARLQEKLYNISQNTRTATKETVDLFSKLTMNAESLNLSEEKRLQLTELINKALVVGGGSTEDNKRVLLQFGQALGIGRFQGQDLKSILQNNVGFAKTIAEGLGVDVGKLTGMGAKGELTSEKVVNAILKQQDEINRKYSKSAVTMKQSLQMVRDSFVDFVGRTDEAWGVSSKLASALKFVADNMKLLSNVLGFLLLPSLLKMTPVLGSFIKGLGAGHSALTMLKRGIVILLPYLKTFGKSLMLSAQIYGVSVLLKLCKELFNLFTGKENVFEDFWTLALKRTEERLGRLPNKFSEVLETIGKDLNSWAEQNKDTWWGKLFFGFGSIGERIGNALSETGDKFSMADRVRLLQANDLKFGEHRFITPQEAQRYWQNQNVNQNVNITINEATQGKQAYINALDSALKQTNTGNGFTPISKDLGYTPISKGAY